MGESSVPMRLFVAAVALIALSFLLAALNVDGDLLLLPGLLLGMAAAALTASNPHPRAGRRGAVITTCVLGALILVPIAAVLVLAYLGSDPLAVFLVGIGLAALAGVLAATYLIVFFVNLARTRRGAADQVDDLTLT